ncbi:MAG: hypothetical protein KAI27_04220, partial [Rhodospirillaceae bacterium]|nr:hypothetical protein [Rhodospirillaceae bacterium]
MNIINNDFFNARDAVRKLALISSVSAIALAFVMGPVHINADSIGLGPTKAMADDDGGDDSDDGDDGDDGDD